MFDFNYKVIFHLEEGFMSSLLLLIQLQRKQKVFLLLLLFQQWNAKGSHFCWNQVLSCIKTRKPRRIQALDWPVSLGAKISETYYSLHEVIPGARASEPVCPTARQQDHQPGCRKLLAGHAAEPWEALQLGHQHWPAGRPRSRARLPVLMLLLTDVHPRGLHPASCHRGGQDWRAAHRRQDGVAIASPSCPAEGSCRTAQLSCPSLKNIYILSPWHTRSSHRNSYKVLKHHPMPPTILCNSQPPKWIYNFHLSHKSRDTSLKNLNYKSSRDMSKCEMSPDSKYSKRIYIFPKMSSSTTVSSLCDYQTP